MPKRKSKKSIDYVTSHLKNKKNKEKSFKAAFDKLKGYEVESQILFLTKDGECLDAYEYAKYKGVPWRKAKAALSYKELHQPALRIIGLSDLLKNGYSEEHNKVIENLINEHMETFLNAAKNETEFNGLVDAEHIKNTSFCIEK